MAKSPKYRAWQFLHPDVDAGEEFSGLQLNNRGAVAMVQADQSIRQAIFILLSTVPGERVMLPEYGCHIHRLIFSPNDDTTAGLAIYYVRKALERWEPRIDILLLDARQNRENPEQLDIILEYRVKATQHLESLTFGLSLI
jgi:uncharacterized protein